MGLSIKKLFRSRETPETERVASVEITDQQVQEAVTEVYLRELAFWTCVGKIATRTKRSFYPKPWSSYSEKTNC